MKALVRKYPDNADKAYEAEVFIEPWLDWMNQENGKPLTDENYHYALCLDLPDECADTAIPTDFNISEVDTEVEDELGEKRIVKSWTAVFDRAAWEARPKEEFQ